MWFLRKPLVKVSCFFCKIEVNKKEAFDLKYKTSDGEGVVTMCPMCAGMMEDMSKQAKDLYND